MSRLLDKTMCRHLVGSAWIAALLVLCVATAAATADVPGWMQSNESGFGNPQNTAVGALAVYGDQMYAGTWNDKSSAQVWRTTDGLTWSQVIPGGWATANEEVQCAVPFGTRLYVGAGNMAGGQIWRTDGTNWEQVAAGGLGDVSNYGFYAATVFQNALYVATANVPPAIPGGTGNGVEVWRSPNGNIGTWVQVNSDGFGAGPTWPDVIMDVYQGRLYVGLSRVMGGSGSLAELWWTDGATWTPVFTNVLGDPSNTYPAAMAEFNGFLYLGFRNVKTGAELWRSPSGTSNWTKVFDGGLGNPGNKGLYGLYVFKGDLYLVFLNWSGAQVWRSANGTSWTQVMHGGWGDGNNQYGDYSDKAAVEFKGSLYIGTVNSVSGGQVWRTVNMSYLPLVLRNQS